MSRIDPQIDEVRGYAKEIQDATNAILEIVDSGDYQESMDISRVADLAGDIFDVADSIDNAMNPIEQDADDLQSELAGYSDIDMSEIEGYIDSIEDVLSDFRRSLP